MDTDPRMGAALQLLTDRGADTIAHPGGTLLAHFQRTYTTLVGWGEPPWIALAGLTHAAYGTDGFPRPLLDLTDRIALCDVVGESAEHLVYLYCGCDRGRVYPQLGSADPVFRNRFTGLEQHIDLHDLRGFADLTAANEIDVARHNAELLTRFRDDLWQLFTRMRRHLSQRAWQACVDTFGPAEDDW